MGLRDGVVPLVPRGATSHGTNFRWAAVAHTPPPHNQPRSASDRAFTNPPEADGLRTEIAERLSGSARGAALRPSRRSGRCARKPVISHTERWPSSSHPGHSDLRRVVIAS